MKVQLTADGTPSHHKTLNTSQSTKGDIKVQLTADGKPSHHKPQDLSQALRP